MQNHTAKVTSMESLTISPVFLCSLMPNTTLKQYTEASVYVLSHRGRSRVFLKLPRIL